MKELLEDMEICISGELWDDTDINCNQTVPLEVESIKFRWNSYYQTFQGYNDTKKIYRNGKIKMKELIKLTQPAFMDREAVPRDFFIKIQLPEDKNSS